MIFTEAIRRAYAQISQATLDKLVVRTKPVTRKGLRCLVDKKGMRLLVGLVPPFRGYVAYKRTGEFYRCRVFRFSRERTPDVAPVVFTEEPEPLSRNIEI